MLSMYSTAIATKKLIQKTSQTAFTCSKSALKTPKRRRSGVFIVNWNRFHTLLWSSEADVRRCSVKKVFLKISQNSQEKHLCQWLFFNKVAGLGPATLLKKSLWHRCSVNFAKFLRTPFSTGHFRWLLLEAPIVGFEKVNDRWLESFETETTISKTCN